MLDRFESQFASLMGEEIEKRIVTLSRQLREVATLEEHRRVVGQLTAYEKTIELMREIEQKLMKRE